MHGEFGVITVNKLRLCKLLPPVRLVVQYRCCVGLPSGSQHDVEILEVLLNAVIAT